MRMESHNLFSITQGNDESIEEHIRKFREEKIKITDNPSSIMIEAFKRGLLRSSNMFSKLTKIMPHIMKETYDKAREFINLKRELRLGKKGKAAV